MRVELLYFEDCPSWRTTNERLQKLSAERGFEMVRRLVTTPEEAGAIGFRGSPTILVDGRDPFARAETRRVRAC